MNTKDYLRQAYLLDQRIDSKIELLERLNSLAKKCTTTYNLAPGGTNKTTSRLEDTVIKIIKLQDEINADVDKLVDLKTAIVHIIKDIEDTDTQMIFELRYLCFYSWEKISDTIHKSQRQVLRLHKEGLKNIKEYKKCQ